MPSFPKRKLVFVVDDDVAILKGIGRLLRQRGYESALFSSVEAFEKHGDFEKAVCVILDINLAGESGIELRRRFKANVPVIFITGNDNAAVRLAAMTSGCIAFLTKPFSATALIDAIEQASAS